MGKGGEAKATSNNNTRKIGLAELGKHRTPTDAWVATRELFMMCPISLTIPAEL